MKRIKCLSLFLIAVSCFLFPLSACGKNDGGEDKLDPTDFSKVLVA